MIQQIIYFLLCIVLFAVLAYGLYWVCIRFFPNFQPALWICGVVLLIIILLFIAHQFGDTSGVGIFPHK